MRRRSRAILAAAVAALAGCAGAPPLGSSYVVTTPVADLRAEPVDPRGGGAHDKLQETQLLYGETVHVIRTQDDWALVEAPEQLEYSHRAAWQGYPGWIRLDSLCPVVDEAATNAVIAVPWALLWHNREPEQTFQLPMGSRLRVTNTIGEPWTVLLPNGEAAWISRDDAHLDDEVAAWPADARRDAVMQAAESLLGHRYYWGGRSPAASPPLHGPTGVDCSGLVNLAHRTIGLDIPRDAHEQYLRARMIHTPQPADLLFLSAPDDPKRMVHVMLYAGDGWLLEAPGTGQLVRRVSTVERLGMIPSQLDPGDDVNGQTLWMGSFIE